MLTREFINSFYDKLPAYGVDRLIVKIDESNIRSFEKDSFYVKDKDGNTHWYHYDELIQDYDEAVKLHKKLERKKRLDNIRYYKNEIKRCTKKLEELKKC